MVDSTQDGRLLGAPAPPKRRKGYPSAELMNYVRRRMEAGKRVGRKEPMALFRVSRETVDWARRIIEHELSMTLHEKVETLFRLVEEDDVYEAINAEAKGSRERKR